MPRKGGFFDKRSKKEAFDEGHRERRSGKQSESDQFFERSWDTPSDIFFGKDSRTDQERAYDSGHDSTTYSPKKRKAKASRSSGTYSGSGSSGGGLLPFSTFAGGVIGFIGGVVYSGEQIFKIKSPAQPGLDLLCGLPIFGAIIGAVVLSVLGFLIGMLRR